MQVTTTRSRAKPFSWSYSRLKNWRNCPKRYYEIDVAKNVVEEKSEQLLWGDALHKALEERLVKKTPLPVGFDEYEPMIQRLERVPGKVMGEQKLAITAEYKPCTFFDRSAWFRSIADVLIINPPVALAVDYKTGKILENSEQLALLAACVFAHYPDVHAIRTEYWWLKDDATTRADIKRSDLPGIWAGVMPEVRLLQNAHETSSFPPKPSGLCKRWCPVTSCAHHGK